MSAGLELSELISLEIGRVLAQHRLEPERDTPRPHILTNKQLYGIDKFLGNVLDAYKTGKISRQDAVGHITHVIMAVDMGNETEIVQYPANWSLK